MGVVANDGRSTGTAPQPTARGRLAASLLWVLAVAGAVVLGGYHFQQLVTGGSGDPSIVAVSIIMVAYASLGWLILRQRPGHRIGWLFLMTAIAILAVFSGFTFGTVAAGARGPHDPIAGFLIWLGIVLYIPAVLLAFPFLAILFPDGDLPGPRWRMPVGLLVVGAAACSAVLGFSAAGFASSAADNPFAIPGVPLEVVAAAAFLSPIVVLAGCLLGIVSMVVRFRRSRGDERQQVKWMLAAIIVVAIFYNATAFGFDSVLVSIASSASIGLIPAATTLAILRYRLYDIDRIISRTIAYAVVTAFLAAAFLATNLALTTLLVRGDTIQVAISTLVVAILFQPLRRTVQRQIDRRFYRSRVDADRTVAQFVNRTRENVDLGRLVGEVRLAASGSRPAVVGPRLAPHRPARERDGWHGMTAVTQVRWVLDRAAGLFQPLCGRVRRAVDRSIQPASQGLWLRGAAE